MSALDNVDIDKLERLCALAEVINDDRLYEALAKLIEMKCLMMRADNVTDNN